MQDAQHPLVQKEVIPYFVRLTETNPRDFSLETTISLIRVALDCEIKGLRMDLYGVGEELTDLVTLAMGSLNLERVKQYHEQRVLVIDDMVQEVRRKPAVLNDYLDQVAGITIGDMTSPGAVLAMINLAEVYYKASRKLAGPNSYILAVDESGHAHSRKLLLPSSGFKVAEIFNNLTYHAVVTHLLDPETLLQLVNDYELWSNFTHDENYPKISSVERKASHLLTFAREHKHFHRPWPHEVIINNFPIRSISVYDDSPTGVMYKIRHFDDTIVAGQIWFSEGGYCVLQSDSIGKRAKWNAHPKSEGAVALVSAIVRDMFVLETVDRFYSQSRPSGKGFGRREKKENKYVWLPKTRINYVGASSLSDDDRMESAAPHRIPPHPVAGHKRPAKNPNPKQLELAKKVGYPLPEGYTYVRSHDHPGGDVNLYKSRSALETLFGAPGSRKV